MIFNASNGHFVFEVEKIKSLKSKVGFWGHILDFRTLVITEVDNSKTKIILPLPNNLELEEIVGYDNKIKTKSPTPS